MGVRVYMGVVCVLVLPAVPTYDSPHPPTSTPTPVTSKYKIGEGFEPAPSLRIAVSAIHTPGEIKGALDALKSAVAAALKK